MARRNIWGGWTKDATGFNALAGTSSISTSVTRNGGSSLRANPVGSATGYGDFRDLSNAGTPSDFNLASGFERVYCRFDLIPASGSEEILVAIDSASTRKFAIRVHSDGTLSLWDSTGTTQIGSNSTATVIAGNGKWYEFQVFAESGGGAGIEVRLRLDGHATLDGSAILGGSGVSIGGNMTALLYGKVVNRNGNSLDIYYSDIAVDDADWCGWGITKAFIPNDVGNYNVWVTGAGGGALWELVDENPNDGSTSYVLSTAVIGDAVTFALPSCASVGIGGPILSTKFIGIARRQGAATSAWRGRVRMGSTDDDGGTDFMTTGTFTHRARMQNAKPGGGTITTSDLDTAEIGAVERSNAQQTRVTSCLLEVECAPPSELVGQGAKRMLAAGIALAIGSMIGSGNSVHAGQAAPTGAGMLQGRGVSLLVGRAPADAAGVLTGQAAVRALGAAPATSSGALEGRGLSIAISRADATGAGVLGGSALSIGLGSGELALGLELTGHGLALFAAHGAVDMAAVAPVGFYEGTANLVRTRAAALTLAPLVYDNQPDSAKPQNAPWIGLAVEFEDAEQVQMGNQYRAHGVARFGVRVPASLGDRDALRIADEIRVAFTGVSEGAVGSFGDVIYDAPNIELGELEGNWWRMDIAVPFRRDRTEEPQAASSGFPALEAVANIARTRFKTLVSDEHPCVTLWENQKGDIPTTSPWAHFSVRNDSIDIVDIGPPSRYRVHGTATAMLFASPSDGDRDALKLVDRIDLAFRAVTDQGVTFATPEVHTIGLEHGWWQINVRCPFHSEFFVS